jgi:hypothetical protein
MTQRTSGQRAGGATKAAKKPGMKGARAAHGDNRAAVEATIAAFEGARDIDAALLQALRSIADSLDARPHNAQMWKEYREALGELLARGDDGSGEDAIITKLRTPLRDAAAP